MPTTFSSFGDDAVATVLQSWYTTGSNFRSCPGCGSVNYDWGADSMVVNYRVDDLDALLEELQRAGVEIAPHSEQYDYRKFAWIVDPDGNRVELWEPPREETLP